MNNFELYCNKHLEIYTPGIVFEKQGSGYRNLYYMLENNIDCASHEEINRWESNPTEQELYDKPHLKYLRFLHPILRKYVIDNWEYIKKIFYNV